MVACRLLCLAAGGIAARAADVLSPEGDASALFQSAVRSHSDVGHRKASTGLGGLLDMGIAAISHRLREVAAQPGHGLAVRHHKAGTGPQHISMSRWAYSDGAASGSGSSVDLTVSKVGCEKPGKDCAFTWGDNISFVTSAHVPDEFRDGDKVSLQVDGAFDVTNTQSILSSMYVGQPVSWFASCELCAGSCLMSMGTDDSFLDVTFPTVFMRHGDHRCFEGQKEMQLIERSVPFGMADAADMQLRGSMNISLMLLRGGKATASATTTLVFEPPAAEETPASQAPSPAEAAKEPQALPGLLQLGFGQLFQGSVGEEAAREESRSLAREGMPATVNAIVYDVVIDALENSTGGNVSIVADFCEKGQHGGARCQLPFGSSDTINVAMHLSADFHGGSYGLLSVTPKVSGMMGRLLKGQMEALTFHDVEMPLCTEDLDDNIYPLNIKGTIIGMKLPACGHFTMTAKAAPLEVSLPRQIALPIEEMFGSNPLAHFGMKDLNHMPQMSVDVRLQLLHSGAVPALDMTFTVGLAKL